MVGDGGSGLTNTRATPQHYSMPRVKFWAKDYDTLYANLPPAPRPPKRTRAGHEEQGVGGGFGDKGY